MSNWQDRFVGLNQLPDELSDMELEAFFRLSDADLVAIREFRKKNRVPIALQVGFLRLSGAKLDRYQVIPRRLLAFLGEQLEVPAPTIASLQVLYSSKNTRHAHQGWAQTWVGIRSASDKDDSKLFKTIQAASTGISSTDRLIELAQQWLYQKKILIPAYSSVREICVRAQADTETAIYGVICKATTEEQRLAWRDALLSQRQGNRTYLEWLQQSPKRRSHKNLKELAAKIEYLNDMGIDRLDLSGIPSERLAAYARDFQHRKPSRVKVLQKVNLALQMVTFLKFTLAEATDTLIHLVGKKTSDLVSNARRKVQVKEAVEVVSYRSILKNIFTMVEDMTVDAENLRASIREISGSTPFLRTVW